MNKVIISHGFNDGCNVYVDESDLNDSLLAIKKNNIIFVGNYYDADIIKLAIELIKNPNNDTYNINVPMETTIFNDIYRTKHFLKQITFMIEYGIKLQKNYHEYLNMVDYERFAHDDIMSHISKIRDIVNRLIKEQKNDTCYNNLNETLANITNITEEIKLGIYDYERNIYFEKFLKNKINKFTQHIYDNIYLIKEIEYETKNLNLNVMGFISNFKMESLIEIPKKINESKSVNYKITYADHCVTLEKLIKFKGTYVHLYLVPINMISKCKLVSFAGYDYGISFKLYTKGMLLEKYEYIEKYLDDKSLKWKDLFKIHVFVKNKTYVEIRVLKNEHEDIFYKEFKESVLKD